MATAVDDKPDVRKLNPVEVRTELEGLGEKLADLRTKDQSDGVRAEMRETVRDIQSLDAVLTAWERSREPETVRFDTPAPRAGGGGSFEDRGLKTPGQVFTEAEGYKKFAEGRGRGAYEGEVRTLLTENDGTANGGLFVPRGQPIPPDVSRAYRRRLFVRDLLDAVSTNLTAIPYIREHSMSGNAADDALMTTVAEAGQKPELQMRFILDTALITKIAGWIPITTEIAADAPQLRGYIDGRLGYMVRLREEDQFLNGNGTAPNLRGIRQFTGLQHVTDPVGANTVDPLTLCGLAIAKIEGVDGDADGFVLNPADYWAAVTTRHTDQYDGGFSTGSPFNAPSPTIWGLPVVRSRAIEVGKALCGAWKTAASILDKESITIRIADQHADYFIFNKLVILAEERVGLVNHRPDWFCEIDFAPVA